MPRLQHLSLCGVNVAVSSAASYFTGNCQKKLRLKIFGIVSSRHSLPIVTGSLKIQIYSHANLSKTSLRQFRKNHGFRFDWTFGILL